MYIPRHFEQENLERIISFVQTYNFGIISSINPETMSIVSSHLPFLIELKRDQYILSCHFAYQNKHWELFSKNSNVQVIFTGPHAYISPLYYVHDNVPTWNYTTVHISGEAFILHDDNNKRELIEKLVKFHEPTELSWKIEKFNPFRFENLMKNIVFVEIRNLHFRSKYKLSQNKRDEDIVSVIKNLTNNGGSDAECASFMQEYYQNNTS